MADNPFIFASDFVPPPETPTQKPHVPPSHPVIVGDTVTVPSEAGGRQFTLDELLLAALTDSSGGEDYPSDSDSPAASVALRKLWAHLCEFCRQDHHSEDMLCDLARWASGFFRTVEQAKSRQDEGWSVKCLGLVDNVLEYKVDYDDQRPRDGHPGTQPQGDRMTQATPTKQPYQVDVPEGASGPWKVERFTVDPNVWQGFGRRCVPPGEYTRLLREGVLVMSDTPDEWRDHLGLVWAVEKEVKAQPEGPVKVLLHGLGLGMILQGVLNVDPRVEVTVVEQSEDVVKLVWAHYADRYPGRVQLIQGDALTWQPPKHARWNAVWHDIWDYVCSDNLEQMTLLHRRFGRRCNWQGSWARGLCERQARGS